MKITTRQAEFLKIFPEAQKIGGALTVCPDGVLEYCSHASGYSCLDCKREFWLEEIEVPDEKPVEAVKDAEQEAKLDDGKMRISIVPLQIVSDIAEVREYGIKKYSDPDNWKRVEIERYANALFRHFQAFLRDPASVDDESGIEHYKHMACNMAFICELMKEKGVEPR